MSLLIWLLACGESEKDTGEVAQNLAPVIEWSIPTERIVDGDSLDIVAQISDDDGINTASVYYRVIGSAYWESMALENTGDDWVATIPNLSVPGIEVYLKAEDLGSPIATSLLPASGPSAPFEVLVTPESIGLPFRKAFDLEEGQLTLLDRDWWTPSETRNTYAWMLNESRTHTGSHAVNHLRGSDGMPELRDWIISPPLDFSTETAIMVGWWEYGLAVDNLQEHSLWVSTGSRLPDDGDFQQVEILDVPPSGEWGRHRYVDLSAFAGEPQVYVGWRWTGSNADEWSIDDVVVRPLAPDISIDVVVNSTTPLMPGDVADISVILENQTAGSATNCDSTVTFPLGATPADFTETGWAIEGMETIFQDVSIILDPDLNPHRNIPLVVEVVCGEDTWTTESSIQIGQPSLAQLTIELTEMGQVFGVVGVGDPESPTWSTTIVSSVLDAGLHEFTLDVTDQFLYLPPAAGDDRWFLELDASVLTTIQSFQIGYGTTVTGAVTPSLAMPDFPQTLLVPEPPSFLVSGVSPSSLQPGDEQAFVSVSLANIGQNTQGAVVASVLSQDPNVTVNTAQIGLLDPDVWQRNESHTFTTNVSVSPTHTTSTPVEILVVLADGVESWTIPVEIDVPFPRLGVTGIIIDDSQGNNDGKLDVNETATLEISIVNSGGSNPTGVVTGELSILPTSTATATVVNDSPSFGFVNAGNVKDDDDFQVTVTGGNTGDVLDCLLVMEDNVRTYEDVFSIVLGETPWIGVSPLQDDSADSLDPQAFDIVTAEYRVDGTQVEIRLASSTVINPTTAFIEAWGLSGGGGYAYYRWVVQSGVGTLQGYISGVGFQPLGTLNVTYPDDHHIVMSFDSLDLDLATEQLDIGFASGWCGPPTYYCDQFPDNWGYPYVSFSTGQWFTIEW